MYPVSGTSNHNRETAQVRALLWDWLKQNWDTVIFPRYEPSLTLLGRLVQMCVEDRVGRQFAQVLTCCLDDSFMSFMKAISFDVDWCLFT